MNTAELVNSITGGVAVLLLGAIGKGVLGLRKDFKRFMTEHTWLLATSGWTRDKVRKVMGQMGMPVEDAPPDDLPWREPPRR